MEQRLSTNDTIMTFIHLYHRPYHIFRVPLKLYFLRYQLDAAFADVVTIPVISSFVDLYLFFYSTSLEKIIFGTGLKTGGVFWDSKYIKEIHCRSTIPPSIIGFNNEVYNNATLYVPKGCNEAYHTAIMWREFKTIVEE